MERREQGIKNLELARHALRGILRDPKILDTIPDGATVVLMPSGDDELAAANAAMAKDIGGEVVGILVDEVPAREGEAASCAPPVVGPVHI